MAFGSSNFHFTYHNAQRLKIEICYWYFYYGDPVVARLVRLLTGSDSSGGAVWSLFSVENEGAGAVLVKPQIVAPKWLDGCATLPRRAD